MRTISVRGASEHNLRNLSLDIPRGALTVFTGVSGSGKSSLVFDTIYKEGQRRFIESLSSYARQFLGAFEKPRVDSIEGLSPTICVDQRTAGRHGRSTVGTLTEIHDYLRLLYARLGQAHCPKCGCRVETQTVDQITEQVLADLNDERVLVCAPVIRNRRGSHRRRLRDLVESGFARLRIDREVHRVRPEKDGNEVAGLPSLDRQEAHTIEIVYDRLKVGLSIRSRLAEAIEKCLELADSLVVLVVPASSPAGEDTERVFNSNASCPDCRTTFPEFEPRLFSFNSPHGACPRCRGLGRALEMDVDFFVGDGEFVVGDVAARFEQLLPTRRESDAMEGNLAEDLKTLKVDPKTIWKDLAPEVQDALLHGRGGKRPGLLSYVEKVLEGLSGDEIPVPLRHYLREASCRVCGGARLCPEALAVTFGDRHLGDVNAMPVTELRAFLEGVELTRNRQQMGEPILKEVLARLGYLIEVGLPYLSLGRSSPTLSGGELQRVRLAGIVGSRLQGVVFVLDEPSIGLHQRDQHRLIALLERLRGQGNTLLVVEHDRDTIECADHIIDLGPGAGAEGGLIICEGTVADIRANDDSITGRYLSGKDQVQVSTERRTASVGWLEIEGARLHNLQDVDVRVPLGGLVAVTGVSGSGKSSLIHGVLVPALKRSKSRPGGSSSTLRRLRGAELVSRVVEVHQGGLSRSPRSNAATYTRIFQPIRELFANTPEAMTRGFTASRFSFNCEDGRCFRCRGAGFEHIEMEFLPSVEVVCSECQGQRYNRETLEVTYRGKTISNVLEMSVREGVEFFREHEQVFYALAMLEEIGLGYLQLGQPANTLSGGEAQRVRLATELARPRDGHTLYVLDEPTTGLHFADIQNLLKALHRLVKFRNTVLVIEHNMDVIRDADYIVDLGPEGGAAGGRIVCTGTPEEVAEDSESHTGRALADAIKIANTDGEGASVLARRASDPTVPVRPDVKVFGARQHNLKNVNVTIPHGKLSVVTGVSGSGKSSLAFDTVFAEGQRIYLESLSTYARRFLSRLKNASVDRIDGLAPSIAIDQRALASNPHSTVGTITEIYHYLRLLYARVGRPRCPDCSGELVSSEPGVLAEDLVRRLTDKKAYILAPLADDGGEATRFLRDLLSSVEKVVSKEKLLGRDEVFQERPDALDRLMREGFTRLWIAGQELRLDDPLTQIRDGVFRILHKMGQLDLEETVYLVIDRVVIKNDMRSRLAGSLEKAFARGHGWASVAPVDGDLEIYSRVPSCPAGHFTFPVEISPRLFSFNSQMGACPECQGRGVVLSIQSELLIRRHSRPLLDGALHNMTGRLVFAAGSAERVALETFAVTHGIALDRRLEALQPEQREALVEGHDDWPGVYAVVRDWYRRHRQGLKPSVFKSVSSSEICGVCEGQRLRGESLLVQVGGRTIAELSEMTVSHLAQFMEGLELVGRDESIARVILNEIDHRLRFLQDVGLRYLSVGRRSDTLSGGEAQRIRLASQIGNRMSGMIYVLDEPTIGLHPRDTGKLLGTVKGLLDLDNTVVLVEHDRDCILSADHVIDVGPGAGPHGGEIVAEGTPFEIIESEASLTGQYLRNDRQVSKSTERRRSARGHVMLRGIQHHNLRDVDVSIPLGGLVAVTGVSGSGKSSLVMDVLAREVKRLTDVGKRGRGRPRRDDDEEARVAPSLCQSVEGAEAISRVLVVDQSPIGRSPRSNPATYTKVWDDVRKFYALLPTSRIKGFGPDRFSFNAKTGRCEACKGEGATLVNMHFMSDVWIPCETCRGLRFNQETLEVRYRGLHVGDLLNTEVDQAFELFTEHPRIERVLSVMRDVGLGYMKLGQSSTTLSGGEAQRVKLAAELVKGQQEGALYILDEPTTGLHFDDVRRLLEVLERLIDQGATIVVVEHNLDVVAASDHVIDLGPDGGDEGGQVIATGTPEDITSNDASCTGRFLGALVESRGSTRI